MSLNKWKVDLSGAGTRCATRSIDNALNPPGFSVSISAIQQAEQSDQNEQTEHLMKKRAWDMALMPIKNLTMNFLMMYMAGNTISIFPIMMIAMMAWNPIKALMRVNATFKPLEDEHTGTLILHKLIFILGHMTAIALALYKLYGMGLLPNHASDWLDFQEPPRRVQYALVSQSFLP